MSNGVGERGRKILGGRMRQKSREREAKGSIKRARKRQVQFVRA